MGSVTIGYKYFAGMHIVACHGPVDSVSKILVGEREAWTGDVTSGQQIYIDKPDLFGGDKAEGGIVGLVDIAFGNNGQPRNDYLQSQQDITAPAYLGVLGFILRQIQLSSLSPYIKPWSFLVTRHPKGWYEEKKAIGTNSNPAHIIRECLTNQQWGLGISASDIDDASFTAAADTLYTEGFGLSFVWYDPESVSDFIVSIGNHVDAVTFVHPSTGLFTLKLIRKDYAFGELIRLNQDTILNIEEYERPGPTELINEVTVRWEDNNAKAAAITVHDLGALAANGDQPNATTLDYAGVVDADVATLIAVRELIKLARPLLRVTLTAKRIAASLTVGSAFVFDWPDYGVEGVVMRVGQIEYGTPDDPTVRIVCSEDIFDNPSAVYLAPPVSGWVNTYGAPVDVTYKHHSEPTWWDIIHRIAGESATLQAEFGTEGAMLMSAAVRPVGGMLNFQAWSRQGAAAYEQRGFGDFCPSAITVGALSQTTTTFEVTNEAEVSLVEPGTWFRITGGAKEEICSFVSYDPVTHMLVCNRAVLDTTPQTHPAGARLWFSEYYDFIGDEQRYLESETLDVKLLPVGSAAVLDLASASNFNYTFTARHMRPYPPGNVLVNAVGYPTSVTGDLTITWAHRDRLSQTAYLVTQGEASIGPEAGTTYTIRIYNAQSAGTLIRTYTGLAGTSQVYTVAQATADNLGVAPTNLRIEIEAVRGTYVSQQYQSRAFQWV